MKNKKENEMPNWVNQNVTITGSADEITKVKELVSKSYVRQWADKEYNNETAKWEFVELKSKVETPIFSFWNITKPEDKLLDIYHGIIDDKPKIAGLTIVDRVHLEMASSNGWYEWNCRNWGSKWDACDVDLTVDEPTHLTYVYNTAWSPSLPAIQELSRQYPNLVVHIEYEEEQGWGGEVAYEGGKVTHESEYDIPESHAEVEERGNECFCAGLDEKVFEDCPTA